jgi:hypothetical protein
LKSPAVEAEPHSAAPRRWLELAFGFACIFGGLSLFGRGLGRLYVSLHAWLGGALLPSSLESGVELAFRTGSIQSDLWSLPLWVMPPSPQSPFTIPIETRTLLFLPTACFIALAVATPLGNWRRNLRLLSVGLLLLEPLLVGLAALPILSFLGGTGPVRAFDLGIASHTVIQILVPPGMAFAIPLLLWWMLLKRLGPGAQGARAATSTAQA